MNGAHGEVVDEDAGRFLRLNQRQSLAEQPLNRALELVEDCFLSGDDLAHEVQFPVLLRL